MQNSEKSKELPLKPETRAAEANFRKISRKPRSLKGFHAQKRLLATTSSNRLRLSNFKNDFQYFTCFLAPALLALLTNVSASVPCVRFLVMSKVFLFFLDVLMQISLCFAIRSSAKLRPQFEHWARSSLGLGANTERRAGGSLAAGAVFCGEVCGGARCGEALAGETRIGEAGGDSAAAA